MNMTINQKIDVSANNLFDKITLIVPERRPVIDVISQLQIEEDTAKNIKNEQTRKNVLEALDNIITYLKNYKEIPKDGLILYAHKKEIGLQFSKEPVNINLYRCDDHFYNYMGETL